MNKLISGLPLVLGAAVCLVLGLWRGVRRRHYISHASDA